MIGTMISDTGLLVSYAIACLASEIASINMDTASKIFKGKGKVEKRESHKKRNIIKDNRVSTGWR